MYGGVTHYDPTQQRRCAMTQLEDSFCSCDNLALLYVDCPKCLAKTSFKRLQREYDVVERYGVKCVRIKLDEQAG